MGRPRAEVDGRLAVYALPRSVHNLMADDALTYAEALLLTQVAEHPGDIDTVLERRATWGWTIGQGVDHVRDERARAIKAGATREKLTRQKVAIIDTPEHGYFTGRNTERRLGSGWGEVGMTRNTHRKEPCHAAYIGRDGAAVYCCINPRRHAEDGADGGTPIVDVKAERAAKRAANKQRRQAATERITAACALLAGQHGTDIVDYLCGAVLDHAPREILPAAAQLLGVTVPGRSVWEASGAAEAALHEHGAVGLDARIRVAVAIHCALAEKDAGAEIPSFRGGPGVIAYTDLLTANGYKETVGDEANRDRYRVRDSAEPGADRVEDDGGSLGGGDAVDE